MPSWSRRQKKKEKPKFWLVEESKTEEAKGVEAKKEHKAEEAKKDDHLVSLGVLDKFRVDRRRHFSLKEFFGRPGLRERVEAKKKKKEVKGHGSNPEDDEDTQCKYCREDDEDKGQGSNWEDNRRTTSRARGATGRTTQCTSCGATLVQGVAVQVLVAAFEEQQRMLQAFEDAASESDNGAAAVEPEIQGWESDDPWF